MWDLRETGWEPDDHTIIMPLDLDRSWPLDPLGMCLGKDREDWSWALAESADFAGGKLRIFTPSQFRISIQNATIVLYDSKGSIFDTFIWYRKYTRISLYQLPCQLSY